MCEFCKLPKTKVVWFWGGVFFWYSIICLYPEQLWYNKKRAIMNKQKLYVLMKELLCTLGIKEYL